MQRSGKRSCGAIDLASETGLTLIEMLATLAITAFLFYILAQFLFSGVQLWAKNDQAYQRQHQLSGVYRILTADLSGMIPGSFLPEPAAQGDQYQFSCWNETAQGLVQIKYRYDPTAGCIIRSSGFWGAPPVEVKLFEGVTAWQFEYFQADHKQWRLSWNPEKRNQLPALVRVTAQTNLGQLGGITIPVQSAAPEVSEAANEEQ